jgi:hypothetical protein
MSAVSATQVLEYLAQVRIQWWILENTVMNLRAVTKQGIS